MKEFACSVTNGLRVIALANAELLDLFLPTLIICVVLKERNLW